MPGLPAELEVYPVHHLPILKAYADQLGLVGLIHHYVPTEMNVDAGTVVLGLVLETLSGRSPLYRLEEFFAHQDTELLLGKALPPHALNDDTVGRVLDRLYDFGTMRLLTACAVRAATRFGLERRYVHFDTTSRSVWGDSQCAETQDLPFQVTYGSSKDKRPDLKQCVLSTLCVDRAVPMWGKPDKPCHDLLYISGAFRRLYPVGRSGGFLGWQEPQSPSSDRRSKRLATLHNALALFE
jgi:Domain of unknown function (DUF4277)